MNGFAGRRHLSVGQRAVVGTKAMELYEAEAKERKKRKSKNSVGDNCPQQSETSKARDKAGRAAGVSGKSIDRAKKVVQHGAPELN